MSPLRIHLTLALCFIACSSGEAQQSESSNLSANAAARAKLRPIGSPGLVDALRQSAPVANRPAAGQKVQQTAWMQATGAMGLPPGNGAVPPNLPALPSQPMVNNGGGFNVPPSNNVGPGVNGVGSNGIPNATPLPVPLDNRQLPSTQGSDLAPITQPELNRNMATVDNCACVSAPSSYQAGGMWGCESAYTVQPCSSVVPVGAPYVPPPATYVPQQVVMPNAMPPAFVPSAGFKPLISLGQNINNVQIGQGLIGQPKAYVPGQSIRNFFRYFTP